MIKESMCPKRLAQGLHINGFPVEKSNVKELYYGRGMVISLSRAMKWLREEKGIHLAASPTFVESPTGRWYYVWQYIGKTEFNTEGVYCETYEKAIALGIENIINTAKDFKRLPENCINYEKTRNN